MHVTDSVFIRTVVGRNNTEHWCFQILIPSPFHFFQLNEQLEILGKDEADPKAREIFHEASRTLEMANPDDLQALGETMFQG